MGPIAVLAGTGDEEPLQDVLQAAFWDDPVWTWLFPDERSRARRLAGLFGILLSVHYMPMRAVWTTPEQQGGALWAPPGHWKLSVADTVRNAPALVRAAGRHTVRALRALDHVDRHHPAEPHWYLGVLGTSPAHQGKGIGSALLRPVLDRCDDEGMPAYLESSKESNIAFYARHGFAVTEEITLPPDGPSVWGMWRQPR